MCVEEEYVTQRIFFHSGNFRSWLPLKSSYFFITSVDNKHLKIAPMVHQVKERKYIVFFLLHHHRHGKSSFFGTSDSWSSSCMEYARIAVRQCLAYIPHSLFLYIFHSSSEDVVFIVIVFVVLTAAFVSLFSLDLLLSPIISFRSLVSIWHFETFHSCNYSRQHHCSWCQWNVTSRLLHDYQENSPYIWTPQKHT